MLVVILVILILTLFIIIWKPKQPDSFTSDCPGLTAAEGTTDTGGTRLPPTDSYIVFEIDCAGLNNIRMQLEILTQLSKLSNRTLILPPKTKWALLEDLTIGDVWDTQWLATKIPLLTASEWLAKGGHPNASYAKFFQNLRAEAYGPYATPEWSPSVTTFRMDLLGAHTEPIWYFFCRDARGELREANRMFGQAKCYYPEGSQPLGDSLRLRRRYYELADRVLGEMGLVAGSYNAIHIRNWESTQYKHIGMQKVAAEISKMDPTMPVLVLSLNPVMDTVETLQPIRHNLVYPNTKNMNPTDKAIVEMLLAVPAKRFVGSPLSTYSTGIMEMRMQYGKLCPAIRTTPEFFDGKDRTRCSPGGGTQFDKIIVSQG